jgi:hypothetical protein
MFVSMHEANRAGNHDLHANESDPGRNHSVRAIPLIILVACFSNCLTAQNQQVQNSAATVCEDQSKALPDLYYEAVLDRIEPPGSKDWLLSITLTGERKLVLGTTGEQFELWTDTPDMKGKTIGQFLKDLAGSCRLPYLPTDAAGLVKVKWENRELSPDQFSRIHEALMRAASAYVSVADERYSSLVKTKMTQICLDCLHFRIIYDNAHEHFELHVQDVGDKSADPTVKWGRDVLRLAEESFHRPFQTK